MANYHFKVNPAAESMRLDVFLATELTDAPSRTYVKKLIDHGHVKVNEAVVKAHHLISGGDDISVNIPAEFLTPAYIAPEDIPLDIVFQDSALLAVNKPAGMLVHPARGRYTGTLVNALLFHAKQLSDFSGDLMRPGIVHRLDQETSGLILIAKDNITHTKLAKQFKKRTVSKQYVALVEGEVEFDEGLIEAPIGQHPKYRDKKAVRFDEAARPSETVYRVIKRCHGKTLVSLFPKTGRTHQLRVHMKYLGHPILGDDKYGKRTSFPRLALHARAIAFTHPRDKRRIEISTPIPAAFLAAVAAGKT
ncbi:MAG: RluA family pseudouridine synthase [Candidatus Omnitrophica bacterium]|nr:RluA family pseudouridine synthase [Candidatus Omnitrophota bacterium]MCB9720640.1 RluA family pseudouridine synthase [Candidatus Omnitrophota bacterium]